MISVHFQGKPFNITVIQVYASITNAKEAKIERFYDNLQEKAMAIHSSTLAWKILWVEELHLGKNVAMSPISSQICLECPQPCRAPACGMFPSALATVRTFTLRRLEGHLGSIYCLSPPRCLAAPTGLQLLLSNLRPVVTCTFLASVPTSLPLSTFHMSRLI